MAVLVTGAAGFIGMHVSAALLERGEQVFGIDNLNDYYRVALKEARLAALASQRDFRFERLDIAESEALLRFTKAHPDIDRVVHLAAQPGVRYSVDHPRAYITANLVAAAGVLEACRHLPKLGVSRLRQLFLGLWRQYQVAVRHRRPSRSAGVALRRDQESRRADGL